MTKTSDFSAPLWLVTLMAVMTSSCRGLKVIDLTHQLKEGESITWPVNPKFNFTILTRGHSPAWNMWLENNEFSVAEHTGTHMDAPSHLRDKKGGWRLHQIPAERLVGPGVMVDVREKVKGNSMYDLTVDDLKEWESQHGRMPEKAVVLVNSGWSSRYPDWNSVFNTDDLRDQMSYKYPSVTPEAAKWLQEERNIIALGVETPSPERVSRDRRAAVHANLLEKNVMILENVANVNQLPPTGTIVVMGTLNIHDGSGAPMRMLALSGEEVFSGGCQLHGADLLSFLAVVVIVGLCRVRGLWA